MELLQNLESCDVFNIQINWRNHDNCCDRSSEFLCDANIEYGNPDEDKHAIELRWGDSEHDVHSVYISAEALKDARIERGICVVEGYTEEEMPELSKPMRFRLFATRPYV